MSYTYKKDCLQCDGNGMYSVGPKCNQPASDCCGGCYEDFVCSDCSGEGKIYITIEDEILAEIIDSIFEDDLAQAKEIIKENEAEYENEN